MRSATKIAAVALIFVLVGCGRNAPRVVTTPTAQAPSLPPVQMAALVPPVPPALPVVWERPIKLDTALPPETEAVTAPTRHHHLPRKKSKVPAVDTSQQAGAKAPAAPQPPPPASDTQVASGQQPSEESPIGQLSTANDSANTADRHALVDLINSIETGLNAIRRPLSSEEQKTATQVRTFITRAREALKVDDLDGAHTLATKAHLLLQELTKE